MTRGTATCVPERLKRLLDNVRPVGVVWGAEEDGDDSPFRVENEFRISGAKGKRAQVWGEEKSLTAHSIQLPRSPSPSALGVCSNAAACPSSGAAPAKDRCWDQAGSRR